MSFRAVEDASGKVGRLYAALDKLGRRELRNEVRRALTGRSKAARTRVRDAEREALPSGMDGKYSKVPSETVSVNKQGVTMAWKHSKPRSKMRDLDRGRLRHPVFGNRKVWVNQRIPAGMFSKAAEKEGAPLVRQAGEDLIRFVERKTRG